MSSGVETSTSDWSRPGQRSSSILDAEDDDKVADDETCSGYELCDVAASVTWMVLRCNRGRGF